MVTRKGGEKNTVGFSLLEEIFNYQVFKDFIAL